MPLDTIPDRSAVPDESLLKRLDRYVFFDGINRPYLEWQLDQFRPYLGQRVLEIGVGVGGIINLLGAREQIIGLDIEPDVLAYTAHRFQDRPECCFEVADIGNLGPELRDKLRTYQPDSILCINVLEHIQDDIGALKTMEQLLAPGGHLALLVPAHLGLYGPYDRLDGHFRRYSKPYLRTILTHTSLQPRRMYYFNAVGAAGWWWQYRVRKRTIHGEGQYGVMNRLVPVVRRLEALVKPPFGLSLIAVCQRPAP